MGPTESNMNIYAMNFIPQPQYMGGPSGFNMPLQAPYGPIGIPMPHQY